MHLQCTLHVHGWPSGSYPHVWPFGLWAPARAPWGPTAGQPQGPGRALPAPRRHLRRPSLVRWAGFNWGITIPGYTRGGAHRGQGLTAHRLRVGVGLCCLPGIRHPPPSLGRGTPHAPQEARAGEPPGSSFQLVRVVTATAKTGSAVPGHRLSRKKWVGSPRGIQVVWWQSVHPDIAASSPLRDPGARCPPGRSPSVPVSRELQLPSGWGLLSCRWGTVAVGVVPVGAVPSVGMGVLLCTPGWDRRGRRCWGSPVAGACWSHGSRNVRTRDGVTGNRYFGLFVGYVVPTACYAAVEAAICSVASVRIPEASRQCWTPAITAGVGAAVWAVGAISGACPPG